jgi:hypothetical protein
MDKTFTPTPLMIETAQAVFMAMAHLQLIEPVVTKYQKEILEKGQWCIADEFADGGAKTVVTDPSSYYLLSGEDFAEYDRLCREAQKKANLPVSVEGNCPLLEAQTLLTKAQNALIDAMSSVTKVEAKSIVVLGLKKRTEFIELTLKLLAPFVNNPLASKAAEPAKSWVDVMNVPNDFERGKAAAKMHCDEPGWSADGENRQFWDGFAAYKRGETELQTPSREDTLDY